MPGISQTQNLQLKQTQELKLSQKQIQSLKILQLQKAELNQLIESELEKNPVLEIEESTTDTVSEIPSEQENETSNNEASTDKIDYEWSRENEENGYLPMPHYKSSQEDVTFEKFVSKKENLSDYLLKQLHLADADEKQIKIGEFLIGNIDRKGFLAIDIEEGARFLDSDTDEVEDVLFLLQEVAPTGVGSRDLKECLLLQYHEKNMDDDTVFTIIYDFLNELGNNKLKYIAHIIGVDIEEIKRAADVIKNEFSPRPLIDDFITEENLYIPDPDIIVKEDEDGNYTVELNDRGTPRLKRSSYYTRLLNRAGKTMDKNTKKYLQERARAADEFINSIGKRKNTILGIGELVVERQEEFFRKGIRYLKPFTIKEVASELKVHESTISRAVNGKYMISPRGMFELRFFFTSGYSKDNGLDTSRESIKDLIKEIIDNEDKKHPYSDQKIAEILKKKGMSLARRTVSKYREELGILSGSKRREF